MKWKMLLVLIVTLSTVVVVAQDARPFPLLGVWRTVSAAAPDGTAVPMKGEAEMEFLPNGTLFVSMRDPQVSGGEPIRIRFRYCYEPPDVVTYTRDDKAIERQQFSVIGDALYFDHLQYHNTSKLRRIQKTEFTQKPKDIEELPELPK